MLVKYHLLTIRMDGKQMENKMPDSEKITINLGLVDLGKIDLLVDEGFYGNRADFIRTAIRNLLDQHQEVVKQASLRRSIVIGVLHYNRKDLEAKREHNEVLDLRVIGSLILAEDVSPELACAVIQRIQVFGSLRASPAVKEALAGRINPDRS